MKTGVILRGCILNEDAIKEDNLIQERVTHKVDEITQRAQENFNSLLSVFADEMNKKINSLDKYKDELAEEYTKEAQKNNDKNKENIRELEEKYETLLKEQESITKDFLENAQESVKSLMLILFEKFFYTQYQKTENLTSVIAEGLRQLEDSKNIQISINKELFSKLTNESLEKLKSISKAELEFKSHSKESLLLELKSEQNNIEVDFNKQMDKIKDIVHTF